MNYAASLLFVLAGLINFAPVSGVISVEQLEKLYQIDASNSDIALLLRHRAILFGIVGSIIIAAAFLPGMRLVATAAGLISMISFVVLVFATNTDNPNLLQIAWIDVGATVVLLLGCTIHLFTDGQATPGASEGAKFIYFTPGQ